MRISDWSSDVCSSDLQGIYEFAGANGAFLTRYGQREGVNSLHLTRNFRSVPAILDLANRLSTRVDTADRLVPDTTHRSEEHTSELKSLMRISYAVFCLKKKTNHYICLYFLFFCLTYLLS